MAWIRIRSTELYGTSMASRFDFHSFCSVVSWARLRILTTSSLLLNSRLKLTESIEKTQKSKSIIRYRYHTRFCVCLYCRAQ